VDPQLVKVVNIATLRFPYVQFIKDVSEMGLLKIIINANVVEMLFVMQDLIVWHQDLYVSHKHHILNLRHVPPVKI
jgi:hypothetical protein